MTYAEQLLDDRWTYKRALILKRDHYRCTECGSHDRLQVHHTFYRSGAMAWEYESAALVTLCDFCHKYEHKLIPQIRQPRHISEIMIEIIKGWQNG